MHDAVDSKAGETIFFVSFHFWPRFISCLLGTAHELGVIQRLSLTALVKAWPCLLSRPFVLCQQGLRDSGTASFHECPPPHVFHAWLCLLSRPFVLCQQRLCATNQMSSHVKSCLSSTRFSSLKLISYFSAFHLALAVLTCLHKFLQRIHRSLESFEKILKRSWRESERFKCCSKVSERLQRSS